MKEGASKFTGVFFNKKSNKWQAQINLDGKQRRIGYYDDENEAAVDYARAVFKYKGGAEGQDHRKSFVINLNGVPPRPAILKSSSCAAAAVGDNSAAMKKANNKPSKSSTSPATTSVEKDIQQMKRRKKTLCSHPSCNKRAQHPSTLCWRHDAKDVDAASMDAIREGCYWDYALITVGWCSYADGEDASTRSTWKDGEECVGCIRMTRPIAMILKRKRVETMGSYTCVVSGDV